MKKHLVLLPVLCASVGMMLLTGCKDKPSKVTKKYVEAVMNGDEPTARKYVDGKTMEGKTKEWVKTAKRNKALKNAKFGNAVTNEDGTVTVEVTYEETRYITMENIDGKWKVINSTLPELEEIDFTK